MNVTDAEHEALYDGAWRAISGRNEPWGGCAEREKVMRVAEFAAGFRRQGPITDAFREIRARIGSEDVPIHVAADIEQIICETGGDFGDEAAERARHA